MSVEWKEVSVDGVNVVIIAANRAESLIPICESTVTAPWGLLGA